MIFRPVLQIVFDEKNIDCTYKEYGKMTRKVSWKVSFSMGLFSLFPLKESDQCAHLRSEIGNHEDQNY